MLKFDDFLKKREQIKVNKPQLKTENEMPVIHEELKHDYVTENPIDDEIIEEEIQTNPVDDVLKIVIPKIEKFLGDEKMRMNQVIRSIRLDSGWGSTSSGGGSTRILDNDDVVFKQLDAVTDGSVLSFDTNLNKFVANNKIYNMQHVSFETTANYQVGQGELAWNADEETLDLGQNGAVLQIGQEIHYHVRNDTSNTIPNGTAVMATGTLGASGRITVAPAIANGSIPSKYFIGIATENIAPGEDGKVTHFGKVRGINTLLYEEGDILWPNPSTPGGLTNVEPSAGNWKIPVAIVISKKNNGTIFVRFSYMI